MSKLLLLAYDESISYLDDLDFRDVIIESILDTERNCILSSPVRSTIYMKTSKRFPLTFWSRKLITEFGDDFYFTLAIVQDRPGLNGSIIYARKIVPDPDINSSFNKKIKKKRMSILRSLMKKKK